MLELIASSATLQILVPATLGTIAWFFNMLHKRINKLEDEKVSSKRLEDIVSSIKDAATDTHDRVIKLDDRINELTKIILKDIKNGHDKHG